MELGKFRSKRIHFSLNQDRKHVPALSQNGVNANQLQFSLTTAGDALSRQPEMRRLNQLFLL